MNEKSLESQFTEAFGLFAGDGTREAFFDFFHDDAKFVDEDHPSVLDKPAFTDHIDFHLDGAWESLKIVTYESRFLVVGSTGVVTTYYTLRGKPTDSGFRIRHGICSVSCYYDETADRWRGMSLMLDPLSGHIDNASPA